MSVTVKMKGLRDIEASMRSLGKPALARRIGKEALEEEAEPIRALAEQLAPDDPKTTGNLKQSIKKKTKRKGDVIQTVIGIDSSVDPPATRQRKRGDGTYRDPGVAGVSVIQEFGDAKMAPNPFMRPAWDQKKGGLIGRVGDALWRRYEAAAAKAKK